jgi:hypothetical protein
MVRAGFRGVYVPDACVRHRVPADRLERAYFRRWFSDNGAIVAGLEQSYPSTDRYLLNVPRYLWRQALGTARTTATALLRRDPAAIAAGEMRLRWLVAYIWARWTNRWRIPGGHPPPAVPTGA